MNDTPSFKQIIGFSWTKTRGVLFPFDFKRWFKILLIVWISGNIATPGAGGQGRNARRTANQQTAAASRNAVAPPSPIPRQTPPDARVLPQPRRSGFFILLAFFAILPLPVLMIWISSRFNFIFLDFVLTGDNRIRQRFSKYKNLGNSLFKWNLSLAGVLILFMLLIFAAGHFAVAGRAPSENGEIPGAGWVITLLMVPAFLGMFAMLLASQLSTDFVVPVMYQDGILVREAWRKFFEIKRTGEIAVYYLTRIGLGILAILTTSILMGLILLICILVFLVEAGIVHVITIAIPGLKPIGSLLNVIFMGIGGISWILLSGFATLPIPIFFRTLSLSFLARLHRSYNLIGLPDSSGA